MTKNELKIVFLGTPEFAVPSLKMLDHEGYRVIAVVCQPDRPKGRGHKLCAPPVKETALAYEIPVYQYEKLSREGLETLQALAPDLMITAAFGQILSREVLAIPRLGCINVHASLLPKYRGAAPIEWAMINGEREAGVTTMYTVYELDAGEMLLSRSIPIGETTTGGELREQLAEVGAQVLCETLERLLAGTLERRPQNPAEATYYPMFPKGFGQVDFSKTAIEICNFIRALDPAIGAYAMIGEEKLRIWRAKPVEGVGTPGEVLFADAKQGLAVACKGGAVEILELQLPGKKRMTAKDCLRGYQLPVSSF